MVHVEKIKDFVIKELVSNKKIQLKGNEHLVESGMIDSLGIMKLILFLEETYKVSIAPDDIVPENFKTIETISSMIEKKMTS